MRIAMLLGRSTGGIGTHVVQLASELRALGEEVAVVTDEVTARRFGLDDATLAWPSRSAGLARSVRALRTVRRIAATADVLHAHGHQAGLVAVLATGGLRVPVVVSQHNAVLAGGLRRRLLDLAQRLVARRVALVTGASSDLVAEARRLGAPGARLAPVPSPRVAELLATDALPESGRRAAARELLRQNGIDAPDDAVLVLTIARVARQKDLGTLVDAASLSEHLSEMATGNRAGTSAEASPTQHLHEVPTAVWVVVGGGDPELLDRLLARVRASGAPVHFVGPQDDPDRWLRAADVFVLPSLWEARALVVQEAMAAGVPVVATDTGGLRDLVEGAGTLVPVGDAPAVAAAVARFLGDPAARHTASELGRDRAASWDDGPDTARRWREWYAALPGMT